MPVDEAERPSRQVLEEAPDRTFTFLLAVAKYPVIFTTLARKGYTQEEHDYAWGLLTKLGRAGRPVQPDLGPSVSVQDAIAELDAYDEPNFDMIYKILSRHHRTVRDEIFRDLEPQQGSAAVGSVNTLLDRLDMVEKDTRAEAKSAMKLLAIRGYDKAERKRLRDLVKVAQTVTHAPEALTDTERDETLLELYGWFNEWSTIARRTVTQRQYLIALGLANPRKAAGGKAKGKKGKGPDGAAADGKAKAQDGAEKNAKPEAEKKAPSPAPAKPEGGAEKPA